MLPLGRSSPPKIELTERRLETRDTLRRVALMAIPAALSSLLVFGMNVISYFALASFPSYSALASYGIVSSYTTLAAGFFVPISLGTGYMLNRAKKLGDPYKTQITIDTMLIISLLVGLLTTVFGLIVTPYYIWQVATPAEIEYQTTLFLRLFVVTLTPILYFSVTSTILMQSGIRAAPVMAEVSALALHSGFSYIFIGLFHWDIRGVAISALVAQVIAVLINIQQILVLRKKSLIRPKVRIHWDIIKELTKEERPVIFSAVLSGVFAIFLQFFIDNLGVATIAGFALFFFFQDLLFIPIHALRAPTRTLSEEAYERGGNRSLILTINPILIMASVYSLLLIPITRLVGPFFFMFYAHDAAVVEISMRLVNLVSSYYIFYALAILLSSSLDGLGKKTLTMALNIAFNFFVRFVVLLFAAKIIQGDESIAICYPVSWAIAASALIIYYFANYSYTRKYSI